MSVENGLKYYDTSSGYKLYVYYSGAWREITAKWDGTTVSSATITTLGTTTVNATTLNGTIGTAAQTNITSLGTLTSLTVDNITINGTTIDVSSGTLTINDILHVAGGNEFKVLQGLSTLSNSVSNSATLKVNNTHATYASELMQFVTTRAASSAYNAIIVRASGGSDPTFRARGDGVITADGSFTGGGADFAEFMEWEDGNPNNEDRTGMTVVIGKQKTTGNITPMIRLYEGPTDIIVGVVSASPTLVGGSDWNKWQGKHLKDNYGAYVHEVVQYYEWDEDETITNSDLDDEIARLDALPEMNEDTDALESERDAALLPVMSEGADGYTIATFNPSLVDELEKRIARSKNAKAEKELWANRKVSETKVKTITITHPVNNVPAGVTVPAEARIVDSVERVLNPDWDATIEHASREDRKEWAKVGICGFLIINDGQETDPRWLNFGPCGDNVSRWLIR